MTDLSEPYEQTLYPTRSRFFTQGRMSKGQPTWHVDDLLQIKMRVLQLDGDVRIAFLATDALRESEVSLNRREALNFLKALTAVLDATGSKPLN